MPKSYNRFETALFMQVGACNPAGIIVALTDARQEFIDDKSADIGAMRHDPAIRLIVHQLAHVLTVAAIDFGSAPTWDECIKACVAKSDANVVKTCGYDHYLPKKEPADAA